MKTQSQFHTFEGSLYRGNTLVRHDFEYHHKFIETVAHLKATLRAGAFAWPGGYPLYFITKDGGALSFDSVKANIRSVMSSIHHSNNDGWQVIACDVNYEDGELYCDHSGEHIPSAYAE